MMMKEKVILWLLVCCLSPALQASEYIILHVKGEVWLESTKARLKPSDKIKEADKVVFGTKEGLVAVIHPTKGRFIMKPRSAGSGNEAGELAGFVKNMLVAGTGRASTREGKLTNDLAFKQLLEASPLEYLDGQFIFIGDTARLEVSLEAYPLDARNFFFVRYQYRGERINKKVPYEGNHILFTSASLFQVDGNPITPSEATGFQLLFRQSSTSESRLICSFRPLFIKESELTRELKLLQPYLKGLTQEEKLQELRAYMTDAHGKVRMEHLASFVENNGF